MIKINSLLIILFFIVSCSNIEFTYKNNSEIKNPIYNKTKVSLSGKNLTNTSTELTKNIGIAEQFEYELFVNIEESKTRRSVQNNQAAVKIDYKINFEYKLYSIKKTCYVFEKNIVSRFSYVPKSSGFNFGSDESLDNKYNLAVKNNVRSFSEYISNINSLACLNES